MNREMRRLQEREERLQKKQDPEKGKGNRRAPGGPGEAAGGAQVLLPPAP